MIGKLERDYWMNPNTVDEVGDARASFAIAARRRLELIEDNIAFFHDGDEIMQGVAARASFGHTLGHMAIRLRNGSQSIMIHGDCIAKSSRGFCQALMDFGIRSSPRKGRHDVGFFDGSVFT